MTSAQGSGLPPEPEPLARAGSPPPVPNAPRRRRACRVMPCRAARRTSRRTSARPRPRASRRRRRSRRRPRRARRAGARASSTPSVERVAHLAVVLERARRLERHRVDGVAARSAPRRRGRRGRPGSSSRSTPTGSAAVARALAREERPAVARERLLPVLVRELRVRDRELALQVGAARPPRAAGRPRCRRARRRSSRPTAPTPGSPPAATSRSSPRRYASTTAA